MVNFANQLASVECCGDWLRMHQN